MYEINKHHFNFAMSIKLANHLQIHLLGWQCCGVFSSIYVTSILPQAFCVCTCDVKQNNKREEVFWVVCLCVCASIHTWRPCAFVSMCDYCPPTNRCDHVRPVARGDSRGSTESPFGWVGGGGGEEKKKFLSASTHVHTTKSQSVRILPCSVLKCIRLSGALHDCLLL